MSPTFEDPSTSTPIEYGDLQGSLLMVEVLYLEDDIPTKFSIPGTKTPAIRANITVIDGRQAGKVYTDAIVFPKLLIGQLRSRIGKVVLGRLGQGEAKAGMSAPWSLAVATPQDRAAAEIALSRGVGATAGSGTSQPPF